MGNAGVGKTSFILRYAEKKFALGSRRFSRDFFTVAKEIMGIKLGIQLWDTAGQERFGGLSRVFYRDSDAMILSFDILSRPSFESLENWIQDYFQWTGEVDDNVVVCGMKFDLSANRQVSKKEAQDFCTKRGYPYFEVSSKEDTGVNQVMDEILELVFEQTESGMPQPRDCDPPWSSEPELCCGM